MVSYHWAHYGLLSLGSSWSLITGLMVVYMGTESDWVYMCTASGRGTRSGSIYYGYWTRQGMHGYWIRMVYYHRVYMGIESESTWVLNQGLPSYETRMTPPVDVTWLTSSYEIHMTPPVDFPCLTSSYETQMTPPVDITWLTSSYETQMTSLGDFTWLT